MPPIGSRKDRKKENAYLSDAEIEERKQFEKRNRMIKIGIFVIIPLAVLIALYLSYWMTRYR